MNNSKAVKRRSLSRSNACLYAPKGTKYTIIITKTMTRKIKYHIFMYFKDTNSFSVD